MKMVGNTPEPNSISPEKHEIGFVKKEIWVHGITAEEREAQVLAIDERERAAVIEWLKEDLVKLIKEEINK